MYVAKMEKKNEISYKQELLRKGIHLASLSIPVAYLFLDSFTALAVLIPLCIVSLFIDITLKSASSNPFKEFVLKYFGSLLRTHEKYEVFALTGASWVLISAILCLILLPKIIMVTAFTILIISDLSAALYGRKYGKIKIGEKSLEGSAAFVVTAIICVAIYGFSFKLPSSYFVAGIIGAIVGAVVEAVSKIIEVDDNLSIPVSIGLIMWLIGLIAASYGSPFIDFL